MFKTINIPTTPICGILSPRRGPSANGSDAWRFGSCGPARKILAAAAADPHQDTKMARFSCANALTKKSSRRLMLQTHTYRKGSRMIESLTMMCVLSVGGYRLRIPLKAMHSCMLAPPHVSCGEVHMEREVAIIKQGRPHCCGVDGARYRSPEGSLS